LATNERRVRPATHKSKGQIEELIAEIAPKPQVPAAIRKLPVRDAAASTDGELGPDRVGVSLSLAPVPPIEPPAPRIERYRRGGDRVSEHVAAYARLSPPTLADGEVASACMFEPRTAS